MNNKSSHEQLHVEQDRQTVSVIPSHTLENKASDFTEDAQQLKKKQGHIEEFVSEMGGAIDVRIPTPNVDQLENEEITHSKNEQYSDTIYSKSVPNISIFDSISEDFPVESNSSRWKVIEKQVISGDIMATELDRKQEDKPLATAARTDDFLEYQADDSDRVYGVRKDAEGENINDEDKDADKLPNGSSVQHDLSDRVEASELGEEIAVDSQISAKLEDRTVEEVRIAIYCLPQILNPFQARDTIWHHAFHLFLICMPFAHWLQ